MKVYIIGAGPGDPGLLTLRGAELIARCPVVLYTGSLVPARGGGARAPRRPRARLVRHDPRRDHRRHGRRRATPTRTWRACTPAIPPIFGSTAEQMRRLAALGIAYEIVPGVSSFSAAAAALGRELTLPELSQTVILTRAEGRTPMPAGEKLADLARHGATLALFLSITLLDEVVARADPGLRRGLPGGGGAQGELPRPEDRHRHAGRHPRQGEGGRHPHAVDDPRGARAHRRRTSPTRASTTRASATASARPGGRRERATSRARAAGRLHRPRQGQDHRRAGPGASGRWAAGCGWRWCSSSRASGRPASACSPSACPS